MWIDQISYHLNIQVTKVSWEEVQKDSFGGHHNASAYCLVYANIGRTDLFDGEFVKQWTNSFALDDKFCI